MRVSATPLLPNRAANFTTHRLTQRSPYEWRYEPTLLGKLFGWVFTGLGILAAVTALLFAIVSGKLLPLLSAPLGGVFILIGKWLEKQFLQEKSIDLRRRQVILAQPSKDQSGPTSGIPFDDIYAVQILKKKMSRDEERDFISYELNLVLKTGQRLLVIDHSGKQQIIKDAEKIAELVGCRLLRHDEG